MTPEHSAARSDRRLVRMSVDGDRDAFAELARRYEGRVYAVAYARTLDHGVSQDIAQETLLRAYVRLRSLREPDRFAGWICRIAFSITHDHLRHARWETPVDHREALQDEPTPTVPQEELGRQHDIASLTRAALLTLPESLRVPVVMRHMDGASIPEIAESLAISPKNTRRRLERGMAALRQYFARSGKAPLAEDVLASHGLAAPVGLDLVGRVMEGLSAGTMHAGPSHAIPPAKLAASAAAGTFLAAALVVVSASAFDARQTRRAGIPDGDVGRTRALAGRTIHVTYYSPRALELPSPVVGYSDASAGPPDGYWSGARILAVKSVRGGTRIVVMNADGTGERALTDGVGSDEQPTWAPDGQTVYFASTRDRLGEPPREGLAPTDVWAMDADGSDRRKLTRGPGTSRYPAVSPDGRKVVFQSDRTGYLKLFTMNADGTDVRQITFGATCDQAPVWSPDGRAIAFHSISDRFSTTDHYDIYAMNPDGSGLRNLTQTPWNDHGAVWTPDGTRIVFFSYRDEDDEIYVMDADGTNHRRLTYTPGPDGGPRISPDGAKILFTSARDGTTQLYMMDLDGAAQERVSQGLAAYGQASWSPAPSPRTDILASAVQ